MTEYPLSEARRAILQGFRTEGPLGLALTRGAVRALLDHTLAGMVPPDAWSLQGFGMVRMYLDDAKVHRLHVWHNGHRVEDVSDIHTHPWDLESKVVAGRLVNTRYLEAPNNNQQAVVHRLLIRPGEDAKGLAAAERVSMRAVSEEVHFPGSVYTQRAEEIHRTAFANGTVTVIKRHRGDRPDEAYSYYMNGTWVDAAPAPAKSLGEVRKALEAAKKIIDQESDLHRAIL